jgi:hypothetical protein
MLAALYLVAPLGSESIKRVIGAILSEHRGPSPLPHVVYREDGSIFKGYRRRFQRALS